MSKFSFPNGSAGIDNSIYGIAQSAPEMSSIFVPMLLTFIFFSIFLGGFTRQKARTGQGDAPLWSTLASIITLMLTILLATKQGLVHPLTIGIVIGMTILCGIWLIRSKGRSEG